MNGSDEINVFMKRTKQEMEIFGMFVANAYFRIRLGTKSKGWGSVTYMNSGFHPQTFDWMSDMLLSYYLDINRTVLYIQIKF
jgi:hypothetical protein